MIFLNPDFSYSNSFVLSWVDGVTARTWRFVFVILNVAALSALQMIQLADHFIIRLISQLIPGISNVLQKLLKGSNGTTISTFAEPVFPVLLVRFDLNLTYSEFVSELLGTSL